MKKIFIIGPEGSGKTVFMAMLSHFVATQRKDLNLIPDDASSAKYVNATLGTLKKQEWPRSHRENILNLLRWTFGRKNGVKHRVELLDYSGQDVRKLLVDDAQDKDLLRLRQEIDNSDILIYMLDLGGFVDDDDFERSGENAWLLQLFLSDEKWKRKERLVIVSKAERFMHMAGADNADLVQLVESVLPPGITIGGLQSLREIKHYWITSVLTVETIEDNQQVVPIPVLPLKSSGFPDFVKELIALLYDGWIWDWIKELGYRLYKCIMGSPVWVRSTIASIIIVSACALWWLNHLSQTQNSIITIVTGTGHGAGTDSDVYLTIITKKGHRMPFSFANKPWFSNRNRFEEGSIDTLEERTFPVEEIDRIVVRIKDNGRFPAWKLGSISISDQGKSTEKCFDGAWLGHDERNPKSDPWERTLYPSK